jgi:hypothetical protein
MALLSLLSAVLPFTPTPRPKLRDGQEKPDEAAKWRAELQTQKKATEQATKSRDK